MIINKSYDMTAQTARPRPRRPSSSNCSMTHTHHNNNNNNQQIMNRFRGVRMRKWGKWVAEIRQPNKRTRIWLGSYSTPLAAAKAYDTAVFYLRGRSGRLNFPDEVAQLDCDSCDCVTAHGTGELSPDLIRKKAAEVGARVDAAVQAGLAAEEEEEEGHVKEESVNVINSVGVGGENENENENEIQRDKKKRKLAWRALAFDLNESPPLPDD